MKPQRFRSRLLLFVAGALVFLSFFSVMQASQEARREAERNRRETKQLRENASQLEAILRALAASDMGRYQDLRRLILENQKDHDALLRAFRSGGPILRGPQGPQGPRGPAGPSGSKGSKGESGNPGDTCNLPPPLCK